MHKFFIIRYYLIKHLISIFANKQTMIRLLQYRFWFRCLLVFGCSVSSILFYGCKHPSESQDARDRFQATATTCAPPVVDHLIVWQVFSDQSALRDVNAHNMFFLPDGAEIRFIEHHHELLKYAREISIFLERCANITGFYDAIVMLR